MITGFRWNIHGAQHLYKVNVRFKYVWKAMANGFSISALTGKKNYETWFN